MQSRLQKKCSRITLGTEFTVTLGFCVDWRVVQTSGVAILKISLERLVKIK